MAAAAVPGKEPQVTRPAAVYLESRRRSTAPAGSPHAQWAQARSRQTVLNLVQHDYTAVHTRHTHLEHVEQTHKEKHWVLARATMVTLGILAVLAFGMTQAWNRVLGPHLASRPYWPGDVAFGLTALSFAVGDVLWLRSLAIASNTLTIVFNYVSCR